MSVLMRSRLSKNTLYCAAFEKSCSLIHTSECIDRNNDIVAHAKMNNIRIALLSKVPSVSDIIHDLFPFSLLLSLLFY